MGNKPSQVEKKYKKKYSKFGRKKSNSPSTPKPSKKGAYHNNQSSARYSVSSIAIPNLSPGRISGIHRDSSPSPVPFHMKNSSTNVRNTTTSSPTPPTPAINNNNNNTPSTTTTITTITTVAFTETPISRDTSVEQPSMKHKHIQNSSTTPSDNIINSAEVEDDNISTQPQNSIHKRDKTMESLKAIKNNFLIEMDRKINVVRMSTPQGSGGESALDMDSISYHSMHSSRNHSIHNSRNHSIHSSGNHSRIASIELHDQQKTTVSDIIPVSPIIQIDSNAYENIPQAIIVDEIPVQQTIEQVITPVIVINEMNIETFAETIEEKHEIKNEIKEEEEEKAHLETMSNTLNLLNKVLDDNVSSDDDGSDDSSSSDYDDGKEELMNDTSMLINMNISNIAIAEDEEISVDPISNKSIESVVSDAKVKKKKKKKRVLRSGSDARALVNSAAKKKKKNHSRTVSSFSVRKQKQKEAAELRKLERKKKLEKMRQRQKKRNARKKAKTKLGHKTAKTMLPKKKKKKKKVRTKSDINQHRKQKKAMIAASDALLMAKKNYQQMKDIKNKKKKKIAKKKKKKKKKATQKNKKSKHTSAQSADTVEIVKKQSKRVTLVMNAKSLLQTARKNIDQSVEDGKRELKEKRMERESKHHRNMGSVEMSPNILKALKSIPPVNRRKIEQEIRLQLMTEQSELKRLSDQLSKAHSAIAQNDRRLADQKAEYERKSRKSDKIKEELENEKKKMIQDILDLSALKRNILQKQKQSQAEFDRQRRELEDERRRLEKTEDKFRTRQKRLSQELSSIASDFIAKKQMQRAKAAEMNARNIQIQKNLTKLDDKQIALNEKQKNIENDKSAIVENQQRIEDAEQVLNDNTEKLMEREQDLIMKEEDIKQQTLEIKNERKNIELEFESIDIEIQNMKNEEEEIMEQLKRIIEQKRSLRKDKHLIKEKVFQLSLKEQQIFGKDREVQEKCNRLNQEQKEFFQQMKKQYECESNMLAFVEQSFTNTTEDVLFVDQASANQATKDVEKYKAMIGRLIIEKDSMERDIMQMEFEIKDKDMELAVVIEELKEKTPAPLVLPLPNDSIPAPLPNTTTAPIPGISAPVPAPLPIGNTAAPAPIPIGISVAPAPLPIGKTIAPAPLPIGNAVAPAPLPTGLTGMSALPSVPIPMSAPAPLPGGIGMSAPAPLPGGSMGAPVPIPIPGMMTTGAPVPIPIPGMMTAGAPVPPLPGMPSIPMPGMPSIPMPGMPGIPGLPMMPGLAKPKKKQLRWKPTCDMKPLHWTKIRDIALNKTQKSVWKDIDDRGIDLDIERLECLFKKQKKKKKKKKNKKKVKNKKNKKAIVFIGDDKRSQNVGIAIARVRIPFDIIRHAIMAVDEKLLSSEMIKKLSNLAPTIEEVHEVKHAMDSNKYTDEDAELFAPAEKFFYSLSSIPNVQARLNLWSFKLEFDEMVKDQQDRVDILQDAYSQISESRKLKQILRVVLAVGNYLNAKNKKGEANGIRLGVLSKLDGVKANEDTSYNLLMYIYELTAQRYPESLDLHSDFNLLLKAAKVAEEMESLEQEIKAIASAVESMSVNLIQYKKMTLCDNNDPFVDMMDDFQKDAIEDSESLSLNFHDTNKSIIDLAMRFGEKKNIEVKNFFQIFVCFLEVWGKTRELIRKKIAIEKKRLQKEEKKNKLKFKLMQRQSKQVLEKKKILKSKREVKDHNRRMTLVANLVRKNVELKKEKLTTQYLSTKEIKLGLKSRHNSILMQNITYKCKHCLHGIKDKMQRSGEYVHKCWISIEDKNEGNIKMKQLQWYSCTKLNEKCTFKHNSTCIEIEMSDNPLMNGLLSIRNSTQIPIFNSNNSDEDQYLLRNMSQIQTIQSERMMYNSSTMIKHDTRADSGGTIHHLLSVSQTNRFITGNNVQQYDSMGQPITDKHFLQLADSLQQWRKNEFDPETAPKMPTLGLQSSSNRSNSSNSSNTSFVKRISSENKNNFGTGISGSTPITSKYQHMLKQNKKKRKKKSGGRPRNGSNDSVASSCATTPICNDAVLPQYDDTLNAESKQNVKNFIRFKRKKKKIEGREQAPNITDITLNFGSIEEEKFEPSPISINIGSKKNKKNKGSNDLQASGHITRKSYFIGSGSKMGGKMSVAMQRTTFTSHARYGSRIASSPDANNRRRRSTIEHNMHMETIRLTVQQKELMDDPSFLRSLRSEFSSFGSLTYNSGEKTIAMVLIAQKLRKTAFILLENRIGPVNNQQSEQKSNGIEQTSQKRFLLTDTQLELLSTVEFMEQIVTDFSHFGTLNIHENELILESLKSSRALLCIQKLERRLSVLWPIEELQRAMRDMGYSDDDIISRDRMIRFVNKMFSVVSSGARFRKHRKHGKSAFRWICIEKDRLYWKENASSSNQKTRSFNLAKIVAVQEGKLTSALKNADGIEDYNCFSVVSKKVTLDLSTEDEDAVREWIGYIRAYNRHYKEQYIAVQQLRQSGK